MAGNRNSGDKRRPTAILKLEGAYREDRHGSRKAEPVSAGQPQMPSGLSPAAKSHWKEVVPLIVEMGVGKAIDAAALAGMCEAWSTYRDVLRYYRRGGVQRRLDLVHKLIAARKDWGNQAGLFGMTPSDRARLTVEKTAEPDEFDSLLA